MRLKREKFAGPVVALALLLCALASGCGDDESSAPAAQTATTTTTATAPERAFSDYEKFDARESLTTTAFKPAMQFTLPDGAWTSETGDSAKAFSVAAVDPPGEIDQALLAANRIDHVYDPRRGGRIPGDVIPFSGDFVDWLREHPHLSTSSPKPAKLMGLTGRQIDVTGKSSPPQVPEDCGKIGDSCAPLYHDGFDYVAYTEDFKGRYTALDLPDGKQLVVEQAVKPASAFKDGLETLRPLLNRDA